MGAFFTRVHILSTNRTREIEFNGEHFDYYPYINVEMSRSQVSKYFADTITQSNRRLPPIEGDYDGDTVKATGIFSDEANEKARKLMTSKMYLITAQCSTPFGVKNECISGLYALTKM